jgi:capsular exopolysaccharide synthesis family protein
MAETYRSLRANLRFASIDRPVRSLAVTSSLEQEGKTVTTCNLAVVLAQAGSRVVVVDADMRRPSAHTVLGARLAPGLVDVLSGAAAWKGVVQPVAGLEALHLLAAGRTPPNPGALLDSAAFRTLLTDLTTAYDYVLFDVPPVLAVADAAAFFRRLDAVVLLARYRRGTAEVVASARQQIERMGGNVVGVIFNAFDARKAARRGYGYYGYYGDYARDGERGDPPESTQTPGTA